MTSADFVQTGAKFRQLALPADKSVVRRRLAIECALRTHYFRSRSSVLIAGFGNRAAGRAALRLNTRAGMRRQWELRAMTSLYNWFTEGFDTADLKDAKALLDELNA